MLLTITTTHRPATDLGYLLHKHPDRTHVTSFSFGTVYVFYPQADTDRCTAALLIDINPLDLSPEGQDGRYLMGSEDFVNDRPYAVSSFMSVALRRTLGTAMSGRSKDRPELTAESLPLEVRVVPLAARGGEGLVRKLFEPLGYEVETRVLLLDEKFPQWGASPYHSVTLRINNRLSDVLTHLYVLIPVLDNEKHYWVGEDEVEKLLSRGGEWLRGHAERNLIVRRYLRYERRLTREALRRLVEDDPDPDASMVRHEEEEEALEAPVRLNEQRIAAVANALKATGARRVIDLGCGTGKLLEALAKDRAFDAIVGMDVSIRALQTARRHLSRGGPSQDRIELINGSLTYRDERLAGFDGAAVVEVIEHLDPWRLAAFERVLFEFARPGAVILTTPNKEYNVRFPWLGVGQFRHRDHRFEWTREQFQTWGRSISDRFRYTVEFRSVGPEDPELGSPTQMAVFLRSGS